jgi:hypothetical protein
MPFPPEANAVFKSSTNSDEIDSGTSFFFLPCPSALIGCSVALGRPEAVVAPVAVVTHGRLCPGAVRRHVVFVNEAAVTIVVVVEAVEVNEGAVCAAAQPPQRDGTRSRLKEVAPR